MVWGFVHPLVGILGCFSEGLTVLLADLGIQLEVALEG